jgi:hypothetical protein
MSPKYSAWKASFIGLVCALIVLTWQFLTVRYNYHGDWSALFCTGTMSRLPPVVAGEHPYAFPGGGGWDGQFYHAIAHDPLLRRGTAPYIDSARLRYRRIFVPVMAFLFAAGSDTLIDTAYRVVILLCFALGAGWLACLAQATGKPAVLGLAFFFLPASVASIDRQAVDVGLVCFCCGFALYTRYVKNPLALYAVLLFAGLVRDTGLLLTAAYVIWLLLQRDIRNSAVFATAAIPTIAWYVFVNSRTLPYPGDGAIALPFSGVAHRLIHPMNYVDSALMVGLLHSLDFLAATGVLLGMILAFRFIWRRRPDPVHLAILLFALLGIFIWRPNDWIEALDYARILSPLLLFEALACLAGPLWPGLAPFCMVLPRFGLQMASQALGIVRGILAGA